MAREFLNLIGGKWVKARSGETFENRNPADKNELLGVYPRSGADDVDAACNAARKALEGWAETSPPKRGRVLFEIGKMMEGKKEELAKVLVKEMGKTAKEALGEVNAGIDMAYFMAGEGRRMYGDVTFSELPNRLAMVKRYPVGVCGLITPWNFPLSMITWKSFPALICGNTVVVKPAEDTPETANRLGEIFMEAGLPDGVFNIVHGFGGDAGDALARHKGIDMVSFTGSSKVGRGIASICGERLAKVSLELGGKNASIVMDGCDMELAVSGIVKGAFTVAGQRCTATSRAIVHKDAYDEFMRRLVEETKKLRVGRGDDEKTDVCPVINEKQLKTIEGYVEIGKKEGAKLVLGGKRIGSGAHADGFFFEPTIFADVRPEMRIAREEIFGPVLAVLKADSFEDAVRIHNSTEYGLSASIYTRDVTEAMLALDRMEAGVCYVNGPTFGSEVHLPFGGVKQSGNGHREVGRAAIDAFSELKTIYIDYSGALQNAQFKK